MDWPRILARLRLLDALRPILPDRLLREQDDPARRWALDRGEERVEREHGEGGEFVRYRSVLRTNDLSRLVILQLQLDREGIRHYRSQSNVLHGGEVQLFVESPRVRDAEALIAELDESTGTA